MSKFWVLIYGALIVYCALQIDFSKWSDQMTLAVGLGTNGLAAWIAFWRS